MTKEEQIKEFEKEFNNLVLPMVTSVKERAWKWLLPMISKALDIAEQRGREEAVRLLYSRGEHRAIKKMAKKYGTYNYDFMEGVFTLRYAIEDIVKTKKENKAT